jgi:hypothetical protein
MQNMLKSLMRLRLHVSVLVPLSAHRAKAKASEAQGKARHLLYLFSEIHVAPARDQLLHRVRVPPQRRDVDRRASILGERVRGLVWCGGGGERVWWKYILYTYIMQVRYVPVIYCCYIIAIQTTMDRLMILVVI